MHQREIAKTPVLTALLLVLGAAPLQGQPAPQGAPFSITHFTTQEYRAQPQNWSIAQDARGLMYVANNDGILQYDGVRWRRIETGTGTFVRSVAADSQGTVYAGAVGDFGVLRPDSTATLRYVSLAERLPPEQRDFGDVWYTHAVGNDIYFQSRDRLFRWNGDTLRSWESERLFHTSFAVRGQLYVRDADRGLMGVEGDSLEVVPGGERFADTSIYVMLPHGSDDILIGTTKEDFLLYDGTSFEPFPTEADALLDDHALYHGCLLPGGEMALATLGGGVLIIDRKGNLVRVLDQEATLPDGVVNHVYADDQGGLWIALHNRGIVRAEVSSPLSRFGKGFGLEGIVQDLHRQDESLYAATGAGLYRLVDHKTEGRTQYRFEKASDVPATWSLFSSGGTLYAATREGVYQVKEGKGTMLADKKTFSLTTLDQGTPRRLYAGTKDGLGVLQHRDNRWTFDLLARTKSEVRSVAAERTGALWFSTLDGAVFRFSPGQLRPKREEDVQPHPQRFDSTNGLPDGRIFITSFQGEPLFMSKKGLYRVRRTASGTRFRPDTTYTGSSDEKQSLRAFYGSDAGSAWLFYGDRVEVAHPRPNGTYARTAPPALQFPRDDVARAHIEPDGSAWISNGDELIRYAAVRAERLRAVPQSAPSVLVRQVRDAATGDTIYGGAGAARSPIEIPYRQNSVRVTFGFPKYGGETPPSYQYRLKNGEDWSNWQPDTEAVLGNLYEGTYTVQVRARDTGGTDVSRASFTMKILPPWYRTIWAYLSYLAVGVLLLAGFRRYRRLRAESHRAREQARRHRRETEREREARERLQEAHDQLEEANRLKENFLANTSHEFRTPLASIMGYAEVLHEEELPREEQREFLSIIRRSGDRLLNTVDMLLEVSQLRAGALHLNPSEVEVNVQVGEAVAPFREKAKEKGLAFALTASQEPIRAHLPAPYFRRIVENLVDNAVKFTSSGQVRVVVREASAGGVRVDVHDTGVGMKEEEAERLFDEFKQASEGISRTHEGIGLGLTIAGRLARLMGGDIEVESTRGGGSTFTLRLPRAPAVEDAASS